MHAPFAQARTFLSEHGFGETKVALHAEDGAVVVVKAKGKGIKYCTSMPCLVRGLHCRLETYVLYGVRMFNKPGRWSPHSFRESITRYLGAWWSITLRFSFSASCSRGPEHPSLCSQT